MKNLILCVSMLALFETSAHSITFENETHMELKADIKVEGSNRLPRTEIPAGKETMKDLQDQIKNAQDKYPNGFLTVRIYKKGKEICKEEYRIDKKTPIDELNDKTIVITEDSCSIK